MNKITEAAEEIAEEIKTITEDHGLNPTQALAALEIAITLYKYRVSHDRAQRLAAHPRPWDTEAEKKDKAAKV